MGRFNFSDVVPLNVPLQAQFDSSTKTASTSFVQRALGNFAGQYTVGALPATLPASAAGQRIVVSVGGTLTLPAWSSLPVGARLYVLNNSSGAAVTVATQGSDTINTLLTSGGTSFSIASGSTAVFIVGVANNIFAFEEGTASLKYTHEFQSLFSGATGYQKLPSGLIVQWNGSYVTSAGGATTWTFPTAFPNSIVMNAGSDNGGAGANCVSVGFASGSKTSVQVSARNASNAFIAVSTSIFVLGY